MLLHTMQHMTTQQAQTGTHNVWSAISFGLGNYKLTTLTSTPVIASESSSELDLQEQEHFPVDSLYTDWSDVSSMI